ncbi:MAG: YaaR family protein [Christensenellaceae bacterium]|nr:YaaR family protein [Christensenellaceae bacterium]
MKVQDINRPPLDNSSITAVREKPDAGSPGFSFARHLTTLSEAQFTAYIEDLQERIRKQGERIKQRADLKALVEYRSLISELIGETASNAFAGHKSEVFDAKGRHKVNFVIRTINEKLEELTREILSEQQDNLRILQMVDDIRGLLIDLFM